MAQPDEQLGLFAPGHCSYLRDPEHGEFLMMHARFGGPKKPRQMCLAPLSWTDDDRPYCPAPGPPSRQQHRASHLFAKRCAGATRLDGAACK